MTPKEKALELFNQYKSYNVSKFKASDFALIAVIEVLNLMINTFKWDENHNGNIEYWREVESEIKKL
jgi:hypothetical protein